MARKIEVENRKDETGVIGLTAASERGREGEGERERGREREREGERESERVRE